MLRGTRLHFSTAYHPQSDVQSDQTIQTPEDMLRAYVIYFGGSWNSYLPLARFSYNNNYHSNIGVPPFKILYGKKYKTLVYCGGGRSQGYGKDQGGHSDDRYYQADQAEIANNLESIEELCWQMSIRVGVPGRQYGFTNGITL